MCFTNKRKKELIRKEEYVLDPVQPSEQVVYGGASLHTMIRGEKSQMKKEEKR